MADSKQIKRVRDDPLGLEFEILRKDGLAWVQGLSGSVWTDYNEHDPGVTILEQLCFSLTELAYRSGFAMQDYLASKNGSIDFDALALYRPEAIFPCQPVTVVDYCKLVFAAIPNLDDVRFVPDLNAQGHPSGTYSVYLKLYQPLGMPAHLAPPQSGVEARVRDLFGAHRALCEDISQVRFVQTEPCYLRGEIEISGHRQPAEIYADIFFLCARRISSNIRIQRYEDVIAQGMSLEDVFTGPLIAQGYIHDGDFEAALRTPSVAELVALVGTIDGVTKVHSLDLVRENGDAVSMQSDGFPSLRFPARAEQFQLLQLVFSSTSHEPDGSDGDRALTQDRRAEGAMRQRLLLDATRLQLQKLEFQYRAFRENELAAAQFISVPRGEHRDFSAYHSMQELFPAIYGINREGIPRSAPTDVKARAKQLKAYLFPFEQLMANYLQCLQDLPRLFSLDPALRQTYFSQYLSDAELPDIEALYVHDGVHADDAGMTSAIAAIQARYDDYASRRNRVLDVLLAMYGERFPQEGLRRFNYYRPSDPEQWGIENKIHFLTHLTEISCNRAAALNYAVNPYDAQPRDVGSWQKKIGILLGIRNFDKHRSLCSAFHEKKIALLRNELYDERNYLYSISPEDQTRTVQSLPAPDARQQAQPEAKRRFALRDCAVSAAMVTRGVDWDSYKVVESPSANGSGDCILYFQANPQRPLYRIARVRKDRVALRAGQLRNAIVALNQASEGLHVVEHVLLRQAANVGVDGVPEDFYAFRLSVIFPAWTARFSDPAFRHLAEETVCRNVSAHLMPTVYWLDFERMDEFEVLQSAWLSALAGHDADALATCCAALVQFLLRNRSQQVSAYWV